MTKDFCKQQWEETLLKQEDDVKEQNSGAYEGLYRALLKDVQELVAHYEHNTFLVDVVKDFKEVLDKYD